VVVALVVTPRLPLAYEMFPGTPLTRHLARDGRDDPAPLRQSERIWVMDRGIPPRKSSPSCAPPIRRCVTRGHAQGRLTKLEATLAERHGASAAAIAREVAAPDGEVYVLAHSGGARQGAGHAQAQAEGLLETPGRLAAAGPAADLLLKNSSGPGSAGRVATGWFMPKSRLKAS